MNEQLRKELTCTMCKDVKETLSEICYSQGNRVCMECKKLTQLADNAQFDSYMRSKIMGGFHVV